MFCPECGSSNAEGSKFCKKCGQAFPAAVAVPAVPASNEQESSKKKGAGGFWSSGSGIALIAILGFAVIAGTTLGIIFLVKGSGSNGEVDAATVKVWDDYESLLENNSDDIPKITTDQASLAKTQEELKQSQEKLAALQKSLEKNAGTEARRSGGSTGKTRDIKADELAASLKAYVKYLEKMNELVTVLTGANLLDANTVNNINRILADLSDLGADVKVTANKFLADNSKIVTVKIDPPVLKLPKATAAEIQASVTAAQNAEKARLEAEKVAADAAAAEAARAAAEKSAAEKEKHKGHYIDCPSCFGGVMQSGET